MGASNALDAFRRYAGKVPPMSLVLLTYMALVSKDSDDWPFCRLGQRALAEQAMGRPAPDATDLRAVQRALTPLLDVGAVTVDRAGAARADGNTTARYRLNLHDRADAARHAWEQTPDGKRRMSDSRRDPQHPTVCDEDTRRNLTRHPTVCDETPDGKRRPKEPVGTMRSDKTKEEAVDLPTASHPPRATAPETDEPIPPAPEVLRCGHGFVVKYRRDGRPTCALCRIAEDRPGVAHVAQPADRIAPVIDLRTREVS